MLDAMMEYFVGLDVDCKKVASYIFSTLVLTPGLQVILDSIMMELVKGNPGKTGYGCITRDNNGKWIKGYNRSIGTASSVLSELWGLRDGLMIAVEHNLYPIIVEMDALAIVGKFNNNYPSLPQEAGSGKARACA